ncbi:copper resistance protein CopC [Solwaraspora sp. WMMB335]|uniref:copper resistance CopC family protein n=1 Tax=Solwaraspora sp. WMMB335 TaxID=3404118 RepID=UPI003B95DAEF
MPDRIGRGQRVGDRVVRVPAVLLAVVAGTLTVLIGGTPASAHNVLTGSNPADGAKVAEAPDVVRLTFLAKLNPEQTTVTVTAPDGTPASTGTPAVDGSAVSVGFQPGPAGEYTVDYKVLSTDGHWVSGDLTFTLTIAASPTVSPSPSIAPTPETTAPSAGADATAASPSPATPQTAGQQEAVVWWPWLAGGGVLLASVLAGALFVRRRRV